MERIVKVIGIDSGIEVGIRVEVGIVETPNAKPTILPQEGTANDKDVSAVSSTQNVDTEVYIADQNLAIDIEISKDIERMVNGVAIYVDTTPAVEAKAKIEDTADIRTTTRKVVLVNVENGKDPATVNIYQNHV